jgi:hypothetical protein
METERHRFTKRPRSSHKTKGCPPPLTLPSLSTGLLYNNRGVHVLNFTSQTLLRKKWPEKHKTRERKI